MKKGMMPLLTAVVGMFFFGINSAEATLQSFKLFKETYPEKNKDYYSCIICHTGKVGKKDQLNPYGKSLNLVPKEQLTVEKLKAAEALDQDEDGVVSGKEIEFATLPGDPASVPEKK